MLEDQIPTFFPTQTNPKISRRKFVKWLGIIGLAYASPGLISKNSFSAQLNYNPNPNPLQKIKINPKEEHYKFAFPINGSETRTLELLNFLTQFIPEENQLKLGFITGDTSRKKYLEGIDKKIEKMPFPEFKDRFIPFNYNSTPMILVCPENAKIKDIQQRAVLVKQGRIFTSDIKESKKTKIYDWVFRFGSKAVENIIKKAGPLPTLALELLKIKGPKDDQERWEKAVGEILEGISSSSRGNYSYAKIQPIAHPQELLTTEIGRQYSITFDTEKSEQKSTKSFVIVRPSIGPTTDFSGVSHISHLERMLWGDFEIIPPKKSESREVNEKKEPEIIRKKIGEKVKFSLKVKNKEGRIIDESYYEINTTLSPNKEDLKIGFCAGDLGTLLTRPSPYVSIIDSLIIFQMPPRKEKEINPLIDIKRKSIFLDNKKGKDYNLKIDEIKGPSLKHGAIDNQKIREKYLEIILKLNERGYHLSEMLKGEESIEKIQELIKKFVVEKTGSCDLYPTFQKRRRYYYDEYQEITRNLTFELYPPKMDMEKSKTIKLIIDRPGIGLPQYEKSISLLEKTIIFEGNL